MKITVKINKTFDEGKIRAIATATFEDSYSVHGIKIINGDKGRFMAMPSERWENKDGETKYQDVFHPINSDARKALENEVFAAYEAFTTQQ